MSLDVRLNLKLSQRLVMTPNLQQAIKLLQLSRLELEDYIEQEMLENPMLDGLDWEDATKDEAAQEKEKEKKEAKDDKKDDLPDEKTVNDEMDWDQYFNDGTEMGRMPTEAQTPVLYEQFIKEEEDLQGHLCWQLQMSDMTEDERRMGYVIIGNMDDDGYFREDLEELASLEGFSALKLEETLRKIQLFDPLAICARDLRECLLIQMDSFGIDNPIARKIVEHHLELLQRKQYQDLNRKLKCQNDDLKEAIACIEALEPKPGRKFASQPTQYVTPDVYIAKVDGEFVVLTNDEGLPRLRVSNFYKNLLTEGKSEPKPDASESENKEAAETKDYLEKKMRSALWLIKSVDQRQRTIYKVAESILRKQHDFFEKGVRHLKPLILRDVAEDVGVHESTVSRVSTSKYLHCAQGVFELKYFFHSGISSDSGEDVSSLRIKEIIKEEIAKENCKKPLSDQKLAKILKERLDVDIARRTVAKYRIDLGIEASSKRKAL